MISLLRHVKARRVFEFGTFMGGNTLNMALNTPGSAEIFTLDLSEESLSGLDQHPSDAPFTKMHFESRAALDFAGSPVEEKITTLTGNSLTFDFTPWKDSVDFIFIDGGHDLETVESDTRNALQMVVRNKPACIVWHDYRNSDYPELSTYLDRVSESLGISHVEDTMLCFSVT